MSNQTPEQILARRVPQFRHFAAQHSEENAAAHFTAFPLARLHHKRAQGILETVHAISPRPTRILDLACGAGLLTHCLSDLGHRVVGLDSDARNIHWAKLFGQEHRAAGQFLQGDPSQLTASFSDIENTLGGRPNIVLFAHSLHRLPQVEETLNSLLKWIPGDAAIVINEENPLSPLFRIKHGLRTRMGKDTHQEWHRTAAQWNQLFAARGWVSQSEPVAFDPWGDFFEQKWSLLWTLKKNGTPPPSG